MSHDPSPDPAPSLEGLVVLKLWSVVAAFERRLADELDSFGLSVAAFRLIGEVMREPEGVRQGELAHRLGVRPPTISAAVARLERDGLVSRSPDPEDPRARRVHLAPGAPLLPGVELLQRLESLLVDGLDDEARTGLDEALSHLADRLRPPGPAHR